MIERTQEQGTKGLVESGTRNAEEQLQMVARARRVMGECNRVILRVSDEEKLLQEVCHIVVASGSYRMAWIGFAEHDEAKTIRPVASAGDDGGYLKATSLSWSDGEPGQGPNGAAVRNRRPHVARHIHANACVSTPLKETIAWGYRAVAALPLVSDDDVIGVLGILATEPEAFDSDELALLEQLADDIAYGLSNLRLRAIQRRADQLQNLEHTIVQCLAGGESESAALVAVMRAICETERWECARYFHLDEATGVLRFAEAWHVPGVLFEQFIERSRDTVFEIGEGLVGGVGEFGPPLWSADINDDIRALKRRHSTGMGVRAVFNFPITLQRKTIGVLAFSTRQVREPDDRLLRAAEAIGSQIGQYLQRKQAESILRDSEARFRSLTSLSSDWYWEQDAEYRFVDTTVQIGKTTTSALSQIGKRRWELFATNMTEADWVAHRQLLDAHEPFYDLELTRLAEDGSVRWVSISGEPIFDSKGAFTGYRGIGKDITTRKREEKLLALEHAVTRSLAEADNTSVGLKSAIRAICQTQDWECGRYFQCDNAAKVLRFAESWHVANPDFERLIERSRSVVFHPGEGLIGQVWQTGVPLWSADINNDPRSLGKAKSLNAGVRATFDIPITAEGKTIGVLIFSSREVREPDDRLLRAMQTIGSQIGQFVQRKATEKKVMDNAVRQRLIAEFGQQAFASTDLSDVLNHAAAMIASTLNVEFTNVLRFNPDGKRLTYMAVVGWPQEWLGRRVITVRPKSRLNYILSRSEPLAVQNYAADSEFLPTPLLEFGIRSGVQLPIFGTKDAFGVLSVHTRQPRDFTEDEVSFLRSVVNILAIAIERKNAEDKVSHLAQFDTLTGLPNRNLFRDRLGHSLTQAQRSGNRMGVLFVDLDRFKVVNDAFGHSVGDNLLGEVAARLKHCVRTGDIVARLSGDEFAVVLSLLAKADDAGLVSQKILAALSAPYDLGGHQTYVSASIGVALYPGDGDDPDTLLKNADTAMYRAKEQGRNCFQFYLPQMNERLQERLQLEIRLRSALSNGEFELHYQPKVRLDSGAISGFEALLRWEKDDRLVSPAEFIPVLEETGLIVAVGEWVLHTVCEQISTWTSQGIKPRPIAVNLSSRQFQHQDLVVMVERILRETGVKADLLELEITESLLMSDAQEAVEALRNLKSLGVRLAVDDFGTGYSSLSYLRRFPLDTLKIDRAFICDSISNPEDATLTVAIINLAHNLKLRVVAEGVETAGQLNFLRLHGCDEIQGYYFARPLEIADCTRAIVEDHRLKNLETLRADGLPILLLVDDNEYDPALRKHALSLAEFQVLIANSSSAAFEMLARHGADIVISDHPMQEMSGIEFLSKVRKMYPNVVRAVLTGDVDASTLTGAINQAGVHKFLSKSWSEEQLQMEVREAYRRRT